MKKIYAYITLNSLSILLLMGCKQSFLEVPPQGKLTKEQVLVDPDAAQKLAAGVYNSMYAQGLLGVQWVILGSVASDDADKGSAPTDNGFNAGDVDNFTFNSNTTIFNTVWSAHYIGIARANGALAILNESTINETLKNRLIGEVRFLRALFYFDLVRTFGGVPKLDRVPTLEEANSEEFQVKAPAEEIYSLITEDLLFAVDNIPMKGEAGIQVGRVTKGAAQALLAKVYMYLKEWQKAYDLSSAVIQSGKYNLAPDYAAMFREVGANNIESIFEVQTGPSRTTTGTCDGISPNFSNFQGPRSKGGWPNNIVDGKVYSGDLGFGLNSPSADLAGAYEPNDIRKAGTIIFINATNPTVLWDGFTIPAQNLVENPRYNYKAYHSPFKETLACNGSVNDKDNKPKNIRVLRFAEVLLINAEAATHIGQDALTSLNKVRTRAGLGSVPATEENIWRERRVELGMESDRFFDLVRQGRAATILASKGFTTGKHELFPIPQQQIDLSGGKLKQNPNY